MSGFKSRLLAERDDLHNRAFKLMEFIMRNPAFEKLDDEMKELLSEQLTAMDKLETILSRRLELL